MTKNKVKKYVKKTLKMILYTLIVLIVGGILFLNFAPTFGSNPNDKSLNGFSKSSHFDGKKFKNLIPTSVMTNRSEGGVSNFNSSSILGSKNPEKPLPSVKFGKDSLKDDSFVWFGHSSFLMNLEDMNILVDPVFNRASPVSFAVGKPFDIENPISMNDLPQIDVIIISHDHYDHLDHKAIKEFGNNIEKYFVPLGVKGHLVRWGIDEDRIIELDWYENASLGNVDFRLTPSRHFTGRTLSRDNTLWGGWIIKSEDKNIYYSGDGGYSSEFKKIGEEYGPFDIAFVENGAYNLGWSQIHMFPEESVQASIDVNANLVFPVHWGKFDLAPHKWDEPIIRFTSEAKKKNVTVATPLIGEVFTLEDYSTEHWWEDLR